MSTPFVFKRDCYRYWVTGNLNIDQADTYFVIVIILSNCIHTWEKKNKHTRKFKKIKRIYAKNKKHGQRNWKQGSQGPNQMSIESQVRFG